MSNTTSESDTSSPTAGQKLGTVATIVALLLIAVYVVFLILQWNNVQAGDLEWTRRSALLGGVEALAFAAAGAILGTTVQRQVVKKAEDQAADAKEQAEEQKARADSNQNAAEKGRALHHLVEIKGGESAGGPVTRAPGGVPAAQGGDMAELLALARQYDEEATPPGS